MSYVLGISDLKDLCEDLNKIKGIKHSANKYRINGETIISHVYESGCNVRCILKLGWSKKKLYMYYTLHSQNYSMTCRMGPVMPGKKGIFTVLERNHNKIINYHINYQNAVELVKKNLKIQALQ